MFSNPVYNLPPQFSENLLSQNLAGLSLNNIPSSHQDQQKIDFGSFQFPQQTPIDIGGYIPPSLDEPISKWPSPEDVNVSYQRGSTAVRQYNNSNIDDYYKKFLRPITDYVAIPTNGQPTYVYQNLGGTSTTTVGSAQQPIGGAEAIVDPNAAVAKGDGSEEKKHKKKHKKRSSKHGHGEGSKHSDSEKGIDEVKHAVPTTANYQSTPSTPAQPKVGGGVLTDTGAVGPQVPMKFASNPVVYFDIEIDNEQRGRLVMELFRHVLPRTAQNFLSLSLNEHGFGYRLSYFHRIIPGFMAQAGDFEKSNGTGGYSIYGEKFDDEGFPYSHDRAGLLSMANSGPNTNGSQFFITFDACSHLDNKHVVFGQILQGFHLLKDLDMSGSDSGEVLREVKIAATGQLK
jgi:peptidylprolyl isomerase